MKQKIAVKIPHQPRKEALPQQLKQNQLNTLYYFFRYVQKSGATSTFYHGTSTAILGRIVSDGVFSSQKSLRGKLTNWAEHRSESQAHGGGTNQVFFSSVKKGSQSYARRQGELDDASSIQVEMEIPIYKLAEFRYAVFEGWTFNDGKDIGKNKFYNESYHHVALHDIIKNNLNLDTQSRDREAQFKKTLDTVKEYLKTQNSRSYGDEFTSWLTLDARHIKEIHLPSLNSDDIGNKFKLSTLSELTTKIEEKDPAFLKSLVKRIRANPCDWAILPPKYANSPILLSQASKGWVERLQGSNSPYGDGKGKGLQALSYIPDIFLKGSLMVKDTKGTLVNINKRLQAEINKKIDTIETDDTDVSKLPPLLYANPKVVEMAKRKITQKLKDANGYLIASALSSIPAIVAQKDPQFVEALINANKDKIANMPDFSDYLYNFPDFITKLDVISEIALQKTVNPYATDLSKFSTTMLEKNKDIIISNMKGAIDTVFSQYMKTVPPLIKNDPAFIKIVQDKLEQFNPETYGSNTEVFAYTQHLPEPVLKNPATFKKIKEILSSNNMKNYGSWTNVGQLPAELANDPQIIQQANAWAVKKGSYHLINAKYMSEEDKTSLTQVAADAFKETGAEYVIERFPKLPDFMQKSPVVQAVVEEKMLYYIKTDYYCSSVPELAHSAFFQKSLPKFYEAFFNSNKDISNLDMTKMPQSAIPAYKEKLKKIVKSDSYYTIVWGLKFTESPDWLKNDEDYYNLLIEGYIDLISQNGSGTIDVSEGMQQSPFYAKNKLKIQHAQLENESSLLALTMSKVEDHLKPVAMEKIKKKVADSFEKYNHLLDPELIENPEILGLAKQSVLNEVHLQPGYFTEQYSIPPKLKAPEHYADIFQAMLESKNVTAISYDILTPEQMKSTIPYLIQYLKDKEHTDAGQGLYHMLPEELKNVEEISLGIAKAFADRGAELPSDLAKKYPEQAKAYYENKLKYLLQYDRFDRAITSYTISQADFTNSPKALQIILDKLEKGTPDLDVYSGKDPIARVKGMGETLKKMFGDSNYATIEPQLKKFVGRWAKTRLSNDFSQLAYFSTESLQEYKTEVCEVLEKVKSFSSLYTVLGSYPEKFTSDPDLKAALRKAVIAMEYDAGGYAEALKPKIIAIFPDDPEVAKAFQKKPSQYAYEIRHATDYYLDEAKPVITKAIAAFPDDPDVLQALDEYFNKLFTRYKDYKKSYGKQSYDTKGYLKRMENYFGYFPQVKTFIEMENIVPPKPEAFSEEHWGNDKVQLIMDMPKLEDRAYNCMYYLNSDPDNAALLQLKSHLIQQYVSEITSLKSKAEKQDKCFFANKYFATEPNIQQACSKK